MDDRSCMYQDSPQGFINCRGWIIVTGFMVLLISQHLFPEILPKAVLGVHTGSVKIKSICIQMV
jgi:hypothetical protein